MKKVFLILALSLLLAMPAFASNGGGMIRNPGTTGGTTGGTTSGNTSGTTGGTTTPNPGTGTTGNVAGVVEQTWKAAAGQIKTVVNNVVFPALDMILSIAFFGKLALAYFDFRKHGQFEWSGPVILFACLVLTLTAPLYIWSIIGI